MEEHNYKPNVYAKNLGGKVSKNILVSVRKSRSAMNEWINLLLLDLVTESKKKGFNLIVEDYYVAKDLEDSIITSYSNFVDGVILFYEKSDDERIDLLKQYKIPYVVFGMSYTDDAVYISNDNYESSKLAVSCLIDHGAVKGKALVASRIPINMERIRGAADAYKDRNLDENNIEVIYGIVSVVEA